MVRIAPVRLAFNPKTLWFDAGDMELSVGDDLVVMTARGDEFGTLASPVFDMDYEETKKLKSPLKPVKRKADDEDRAKSDKAFELAQAALPVFRRLAAESAPDMNPIAVEYLFEGDKAVFYFDSEERIDFRDLVRKLAAELHVRVDMKQIGVRDGARMVGGLGHCGQELCCRRLGGEFNPVSIRMAKEQDLSLNPQKISGVCGRLMCCLRYEYEAYKDFHTRAPKKNARIDTPEGEGKVVDLDVPREIVSIKVGEEKPVKIPLAEMDEPEEGKRPNSVGEEAWERANEPAMLPMDSALSLFSTKLTGDDELAVPGKIRHVHEEEGEGEGEKRLRKRTRRRGAGASSEGRQSRKSTRESEEIVEDTRKPRRRRSTTVSSDGSATTERNTEVQRRAAKSQKTGGAGDARSDGSPSEAGDSEKKTSNRRRTRRSSSSRQQVAREGGERQQRTSQVGRNSSALRANRSSSQRGAQADAEKASGSAGRRRRRSRKTSSDDQNA